MFVNNQRIFNKNARTVHNKISKQSCCCLKVAERKKSVLFPQFWPLVYMLYNLVKLIHFLFAGLSIHTFHGNFFVRSTDLLSLPNISPDAGFGVQVSIEDTLDVNYVSFQAALLYTSSKGEQLPKLRYIIVNMKWQDTCTGFFTYIANRHKVPKWTVSEMYYKDHC